MRQTKTILFLLLIGVFSREASAQQLADDYAKTLAAKTGKAYTNVPGTRLFFVREENMFFGFEPYKLWVLQKAVPPEVAIYFYELPYKRNEAMGKLYLRDGGQLQSTTSIIVSGYPAKLEKYLVGDNIVLSLVIPDQEFSVFVNVSFPLKTKGMEEKYTSFLKSIIFNKSVRVDTESLESIAKFHLDLTWFGYHSAGIVMGNYFFLPNGIAKTDKKAPRVYVSEYAYSTVDSARSLNFFDAPEGINVTEMEKGKVLEEIVDGFKNYSIVLWIGKVPNKVGIYQKAITNGTITVVFTGVATDDYERNLQLFARMASGLTIKSKEEINSIKQP